MKIVKAIKWIAGVVVIATIGIQVFPVDRTNPPITETISTPAIQSCSQHSAY
jgi:hypothetical protein